jgi:hypothetical protein
MPGCVCIIIFFQDYLSQIGLAGIVDQNFALKWVQQYVCAELLLLELFFNRTLTDLVRTSLVKSAAVDLLFGR